VVVMAVGRSPSDPGSGGAVTVTGS
jgi:hypothetical protein